MRRLQNQMRLIISYGLGAFFVVESFNPAFWRPRVESLVPVVHAFLAIFGLMWLIQAIVIQRQLRHRQG